MPPADLFARLRWALAHRLTRFAAAWLACLALAWARWDHAFHCFDSKPHPGMTAEEGEKVRADGNYGHTWIDFGGQWVFARTAYEGHWRELYHRDALRRTADAGFPLSRQSPAVQVFAPHPDRRPPRLQPDDITTDADKLMACMMGNEAEANRNRAVAAAVGVAFAGGDGPLASAAVQLEAERQLEAARAAGTIPPGPVLGGPLYPPVHALLYLPLGATADPQLAYFLFQWASVGMAFGCGAAVRVLSRGRVWCSVATLALLLVPGVRPGLDLGQNHLLTLLVVLWGWALAARNRPALGGVVWGLLAFKPVWGVAFALAPLLLRNWRMLGGLAAGGFALVFLTLPLVGVDGWREWLKVGEEARFLYDRDENWINLSRDLSGIPKRLLVDMAKPRAERGDPTANALGVVMLAGVALATAGVYLLRGDWQRLLATTPRRGFGAAVREFLGGGGPLTGHAAGFLLLGCYLCCYRFMYYDAALASVGFAALLADPRGTLAGLRGPLHPARQPPARRRTFLFVNSAVLSGLVLLVLFDNVFLNTNPMLTAGVVEPHPNATAAAGQWMRPVPDGTREKANDDGTTATEPKVKWVPRTLSMAVDYTHPWDTLIVLAVWAWCGWRLVRDGRHADAQPSVQVDPPLPKPQSGAMSAPSHSETSSNGLQPGEG